MYVENYVDLALLQSTELGPARVLQVSEARVQVDFQGQTAWAVMALAYPYQAAVGDTVLAIGQRGLWYVIGVIRGTGKVSFTAPGDVEICSPRGRIRLTAKQGVHVKGTEVTVTAERLELVARSILERYFEATRWIKEAFQLRAGRVRMSVDSDYRIKADRIIERAESDVKIDGSKIHLG